MDIDDERGGLKVFLANYLFAHGAAKSNSICASKLMDNSQKPDYLKCLFYLNHNVEAKPGKTTCPDCSAGLEVDDRGECIFADTQKISLPVNEMVCGAYGLVHGNEAGRCGYCGAKLRSALH